MLNTDFPMLQIRMTYKQRRVSLCSTPVGTAVKEISRDNPHMTTEFDVVT